MTTSTSQSGDSSGMEDFGYKESLDRSIGKFASFAAGVSYISILTGTFQLFYFGFGTAGPAYLWSWPIVFVGQMAVALCFMELAAKYPVAGSVYNWSKKLGSRVVGWMSGWLMLTASIVTISAVALAFQVNLPRLWSGFQIIGDGSTATSYGSNAVLLGTILIAFTTLINALGVKLMARINSAGVFIELIAAVCTASVHTVTATTMHSRKIVPSGPHITCSRMYCRPPVTSPIAGSSMRGAAITAKTKMPPPITNDARMARNIALGAVRRGSTVSSPSELAVSKPYIT